MAKDSIVVGAHLTPEEVEEGKIDDAYQPLYHLSKQTGGTQIRKFCETEINSMANAAKSETMRSKFPYLAKRDIARLELSLDRFRSHRAGKMGS